MPAARAEYLADGAALTPLTQDGISRAIRRAPAGNVLLLDKKMSDTQAKLSILDLDTLEEVDISPTGRPFGIGWSWSGRRVAYATALQDNRESQSGIFVYDREAGRIIPVSFPYPRRLVSGGVNWSPDDRYLAYEVSPPPGEQNQVWVADLSTGQFEQIVPNFQRSQNPEWNWSVPPRLAFLVEAGGSAYDLAVVDPDSQNMKELTDINGLSVRQSSPAWSPAGDWIAYLSDLEMTKEEQNLGHQDIWIARPDGSQRRNLTQSSAPATENRVDLGSASWSWDGQWMLSRGDRFDSQGNGIPTLFVLNPPSEGYEILHTSEPRDSGEIDQIRGSQWSYDSAKIALQFRRETVRNWGPEATYESPRHILAIYDLETRTMEEVLSFNEDLDRKSLGDVNWEPDNRSLTLTITSIISQSENITQTDAYRLELPERMISARARDHIGPPISARQSAALAAPAAAAPEDAIEALAPIPAEEASPAPAVSMGRSDEPVTRIVRPIHLTIEEAESSLPTKYGGFLTHNTPRNILIFHGPEAEYYNLMNDLALIDTPAPHILVDMLAVEMTEDANRTLGLDWTFGRGKFGFFLPEGNAIRNLAPDPSLDGLLTFPGPGQLLFQGVGELPKEFFVRLDTLVQEGEATILANPRTVSESGKESVIEIRKVLNFFFNEGFDTAGRPIVKKSDITANTTGRITPVLLPNGSISMIVDVGVGTFTFTPDEDLPEQTTRTSTTEVTVREGESLVIGGLRQQEEVYTESRTPILGDIPWIKHLFRKRSKGIKHSVLTIFIQPQVLREGQENLEWPQLSREEHGVKPIMPD